MWREVDKFRIYFRGSLVGFNWWIRCIMWRNGGRMILRFLDNCDIHKDGDFGVEVHSRRFTFWMCLFKLPVIILNGGSDISLVGDNILGVFIECDEIYIHGVWSKGWYHLERKREGSWWLRLHWKTKAVTNLRKLKKKVVKYWLQTVEEM